LKDLLVIYIYLLFLYIYLLVLYIYIYIYLLIGLYIYIYIYWFYIFIYLWVIYIYIFIGFIYIYIYICYIYIYWFYIYIYEVCGSVVVKALRYYSEGLRIDFRWCHWIFYRKMDPGLTQPLVKMSTRNIPEGKGGRCVRLTTSPPSRDECHEIWEPKLPGTLWATPGLLQDSCIFTLYIYIWGKIYHSARRDKLEDCHLNDSHKERPKTLEI
jgi:hypothetical protein